MVFEASLSPIRRLLAGGSTFRPAPSTSFAVTRVPVHLPAVCEVDAVAFNPTLNEHLACELGGRLISFDDVFLLNLA